MMNNVKIEIFLGIIIPLRFAPKEATNLLNVLISDLCKIEVEFPIDPKIKVFVKTEQVKVLRGEKNALWKKHKTYFRKEIILKFSAEIYFPDQDYSDFTTKEYSSNEFYLEHILIPDFEKRFYDFIVSIDISRVGGLHTGLGLLFSNKKFIKTLSPINLYPLSILEYSLEKKWPVFESLDLLKTWNWYLTKVSPNNVDEISSTRLGRAINAFTHLYANTGEIEQLFWCMVGIEALYVNGKEGIGEQVKKKAQIFLGEITEFKKQLSTMYEYRSAFVHGSKDFPSYFHINDALDSYEKYCNEYGNALDVAKALLIATLQKMAKNNLSELEFEYVVKTEK